MTQALDGDFGSVRADENNELFKDSTFAALLEATVAEALVPDDVLPSDYVLVVEKVGVMPGAGSFTNFQSPVAIGGSIFGINSSGGKIYRSKQDGRGDAELVFDIATDLPAGLVVNDPEGIANIVGGKGNRVFVAFTSDTLPDLDGIRAGSNFSFTSLDLPEYAQPGLVPVAFGGSETKLVDDLYRLEADDLAGFPPFIPKNFGLKWQVIYEFEITGNELKAVKPIAAFEVQSSITGHHGTGMEFTDDGRILWATGDNLPFGTNGRMGAQDDAEIPSKLFLIDPKTGEVQLAAKGLRNVQHLEITKVDGTDYLAFADIGGVTAEEINVVKLSDILDTSYVENFGWGVDAETGLAREGTFYVGGEDNGIAGILGTQPPATGVATIGEEGFVQPHAQYGRIGAFSFVAASGPVISDVSLGDELSMIFGDLATGTVFGTTDPFDSIAADVFEINLVDEAGNATTLQELAGGRADPRFFTFNDGSAGVFLEATGEYFRLTEQSVYDDGIFG